MPTYDHFLESSDFIDLLSFSALYHLITVFATVNASECVGILFTETPTASSFLSLLLNLFRWFDLHLICYQSFVLLVCLEYLFLFQCLFDIVRIIEPFLSYYTYYIPISTKLTGFIFFKNRLIELEQRICLIFEETINNSFILHIYVLIFK